MGQAPGTCRGCDPTLGLFQERKSYQWKQLFFFFTFITFAFAVCVYFHHNWYCSPGGKGAGAGLWFPHGLAVYGEGAGVTPCLPNPGRRQRQLPRKGRCLAALLLPPGFKQGMSPLLRALLPWRGAPGDPPAPRADLAAGSPHLLCFLWQCTPSSPSWSTWLSSPTWPST